MVLTGKQLESALATVRQSVRLINLKHQHLGDIQASQVIDALASGKCDCIGKPSGVLRYIRVNTHGSFAVVLRGVQADCWLNTQAAVLRFHGE